MKFTIIKIYSNLQYSLRGLRLALSEHSFFLEILLGALFAITFYLSDGFYDGNLLAVIISYPLLLSFELLNTAIEMICDKLTLEYDEDIRTIKDLSSSAVFLLVILNFFTMANYFLKFIN